VEDRDLAERQARAAKNQALFRTVNERLEGLAETFQLTSDTASFACECADLSCVERIDLMFPEYEALRAEANRFAVLPGHVFRDVERIVSENERFAVVEKLGEGAKIATQAHERSAALIRRRAERNVRD
jgi:hypothetical protein